MGVFSRSGGGRCTPALSRPWNGSPQSGWPSRLISWRTTPMRGEVWDKAVAYGRQAGTRAMARSAYREAVTVFEQALVALQHLPESHARHEQAIDIRLDLRSALLPLGEHARIFDHVSAAEPLAEALGDPHRLCLISYNLCWSFSAMGDHERAIATAQRALALATASGAVDLHIMTQTRLGLVYYGAGDFREALHVARRVVEAPEGQSVPPASANSPCPPSPPVTLWPCVWPTWGRSPRAWSWQKKPSRWLRRSSSPTVSSWRCWVLVLSTAVKGISAT